MMNEAVTRPELARLIDVFPDRSLAIRQLFLRDEGFRDICEEYPLARETLDRFEALPDAGQRPEPADYRTIISELEVEIAGLLSEDPKQPRPLRDSARNQRRPE